MYYDCTNYFFEIEEENGLKQYGKSKKNRPSSIVKIGLFMYGNGVPLVLNITPGNTNEQIALQPLEEKSLKTLMNLSYVLMLVLLQKLIENL